MDHLYPDSVCFLHCMGMATRCSDPHIASSISIEQAVIGYKSACISHLWIPEGVQANYSFREISFTNYLGSRNAEFQLVPPQQNLRDRSESKIGVIRSIFLKLCAVTLEINLELHALRSVSISNALYGNDVFHRLNFPMALRTQQKMQVCIQLLMMPS